MKDIGEGIMVNGEPEAGKGNTCCALRVSSAAAVGTWQGLPIADTFFHRSQNPKFHRKPLIFNYCVAILFGHHNTPIMS
jgi:hypothetical protein